MVASGGVLSNQAGLATRFFETNSASQRPLRGHQRVSRSAAAWSDEGFVPLGPASPVDAQSTRAAGEAALVAVPGAARACCRSAPGGHRMPSEIVSKRRMNHAHLRFAL